MRRFYFGVLLAAFLFTTALISGCNPEDEINDATAQTEDFDKNIDDMPIVGVAGYCSPLTTFDTLMNSLSWWSDAKDHLDDVTIEELSHKIKDNESTAAVTVDIYVTDTAVTDVSTLSEDDKIASTGQIAVGTEIDEWTPLTVTPGTEKRLEELITESDTSFSLCAKIPEVEAGTVDATAVNLKLGLRISGTVTFVPL